MKASVEWLKEYSDIDVNVEELADILTMSGTKVETIDKKGDNIKNVVVGEILEIKKHPNADKLVVTKVNTGDAALQIVTGANNIKEGDIVPIAKVGAELPGGVKIKKGNLRGEDSCGMMCSIGELELTIAEYPNQIEDGIMILPKGYKKYIGKDIVDVLDLKEEIIDFEITPNRADCFGVEGIGRETAVSLNKPFKAPHKNIDELKIQNKKEIEGLKVDITAPDLCYRYIARVVKDVKIEPSPKWMVKRLKACGVRSINNIVDITNYVMLEMGQPMHAFDINSIEGKHITVRRAKPQEKITTLDGVERTLDKDDLVIADAKKPVAIAGVMGGQNSEIEEDTKTLVFESAVFYGGSVRKTAKKVGLRTEASSRYEKGLSPENAERAINRAIELVELLKAGKAVDGKIDVYPTKQKQNKIPLEPERINKLLGTEVSKKDMIKILEKLEIKVENDVVIPPYFRQDIEQCADVAEEVARFYGYDKLGSTLVQGEATIGILSKAQKQEDRIKQVLINSGLSEIYTYGFINENDLDKINMPKNSNLRKYIIKIRNPLSEDYKVMRTTTIPSMLASIATNANYKNESALLYDISKTYKNIDGAIEKATVPLEEKVLTIGMYGKGVTFYTLKGILENVLQVANLNRYDIEKETENTTFHPGRCANIKVGKDIIATFGEIHPIVAENYGVNERIYLAELNLDKVSKYSKEAKKYVEVPKFPAAQRDIAIIVDEKVEVGSIEKIITKKAKKLLEKIELFDIYRDEKLGKDKKSVAYSLTFRNKSRTLNDDEVNVVMNDITKELEKTLGAELRK